MNERPPTPLTYLAEIVASSWRHGGELAVALTGVVLVSLTAVWMFSVLHLQTLRGPSEVASVFLLPIGAVLLFEVAVAAWRLYRRQAISLATVRSLLDLNDADRADFEQHLRSTYRARETMLEERHAASVGHNVIERFKEHSS
jgi:hypothetical protein